MARYDAVDLKLTDDGDLEVFEEDFLVVRNQEFINQSARNRMKTNDPDWYDYVISDIGCNLEDLRGLPNTQETAEKGVNLLSTSLLSGSLIEPEDLYIQPAPINKDVIVFFVYINLESNGKPLGFEVTYNLSSGQTVRSL